MLEGILSLPVHRSAIPLASILATITWAVFIETAGILVTTRPIIVIIKHGLLTLGAVDSLYLDIDKLNYRYFKMNMTINVHFTSNHVTYHRMITNSRVWTVMIQSIKPLILYLGAASFSEGIASGHTRQRAVIRTYALTGAVAAYHYLANNHYHALPSVVLDSLPVLTGSLFVFCGILCFHRRCDI